MNSKNGKNSSHFSSLSTDIISYTKLVTAIQIAKSQIATCQERRGGRPEGEGRGFDTWKQSLFPFVRASPPILINTLDMGDLRPLRETQFIVLLRLIVIFCNRCLPFIIFFVGRVFILCLLGIVIFVMLWCFGGGDRGKRGCWDVFGLRFLAFDVV